MPWAEFYNPDGELTVSGLTNGKVKTENGKLIFLALTLFSHRFPFLDFCFQLNNSFPFSHFRFPFLLLQAAAAIVAAAIVIGLLARLYGGAIVEEFLFGLAGLGLCLAGTNVVEAGLVDERLELGAGSPAHVHILDEGGAERLGVVGRRGLEGHVEGAQIAKAHAVTQEHLLPDAFHQLGGDCHDVALGVLGAMAGHVLCHVTKVKVLRILRYWIGFVALLGLARTHLA